MSVYIPDTAYNPAFPSEWEGLGYESAEKCTPRWYGVSSGDGNDGVSHSFPGYYVRTSDPWLLARAAIISEFNDRQFAADTVDVDGEAEYTISATLYEGPDGETAYGAAWFIVEVFPVGDINDWVDLNDPWHKPTYDNLELAIDSTSLALAIETRGVW